jgi:hypothetical protein
MRDSIVATANDNGGGPKTAGAANPGRHLDSRRSPGARGRSRDAQGNPHGMN